MSDPIVAAHPWVYAAQRQDRDVFPIIETVMTEIAAAGFGGIELMANVLAHDDSVATIAALRDRLALPVLACSFGAPLWDAEWRDAALADAGHTVERLAALGGSLLGVSTGPTREPKKPEQLDYQADLLREIDAICREHGVTMNLHNHTYEVEGDEYELSETLARFPEAKLGPDLDWLRGADVDPLDFLRRHGDRIVFAHLRDSRNGRWVEGVGDGEIDYAEVRAAFDAIGFAGPVAVELAWHPDFVPTRPLAETWRRSRAHLRQHLGW